MWEHAVVDTLKVYGIFEYPLSYIVKIFDETEEHYWNSYEKYVDDEAWAEISALADNNTSLFVPFATDFFANIYNRDLVILHHIGNNNL